MTRMTIKLHEATTEDSTMPKLNIRMHNLAEKKGDVDLDAMMSEFKQALLGTDFKLKAFSENTKVGQQLVVAVDEVGEFFCQYELVYNGGSFKVRTWDADSAFDMQCDMSLFKKLEAIFNKYCA